MWGRWTSSSTCARLPLSSVLTIGDKERLPDGGRLPLSRACGDVGGLRFSFRQLVVASQSSRSLPASLTTRKATPPSPSICGITTLWARVHQLRDPAAYFRSIGVVDQPSLRSGAERGDSKRDCEGRVKGLGIAVYQ